MARRRSGRRNLERLWTCHPTSLAAPRVHSDRDCDIKVNGVPLVIGRTIRPTHGREDEREETYFTSPQAP